MPGRLYAPSARAYVAVLHASPRRGEGLPPRRRGWSKRNRRAYTRAEGVPAVLELLRTARGIFRSLRLYYGDRGRRAAMERLYAQFIEPGDLVFDIGAHVGDRIAAFRRLGARVVAVEPQPPLAKVLRLLYGRDRNVTIEPV